MVEAVVEPGSAWGSGKPLHTAGRRPSLLG